MRDRRRRKVKETDVGRGSRVTAIPQVNELIKSYWHLKNRKTGVCAWHTSVKPDVLHSREGIPAWGYWHCGRHLSVLAVQWVGTSPLALGTLARFRRPGRRRTGGLGAGGGQGIVILVKCPRNLVKGAGCRRKIIVVRWALIALHGSKGVAWGFEGVHLFIVRIGIAYTAKSRRLRAVTLWKDVASLLRGVIIHW